MSITEKKQSPKQPRKKRISARLPVTIGADDGYLRDISVSGMFIVQSAQQEVGSHIDFTIDINTPMGMIKLHCDGTVARLEKIDGKVGMGVKVIKQFGKRLISDKLQVDEVTWDETE